MKVQILFVVLAISLVACEETSLEKNFNPISFLTCLGDGFSTVEKNFNKMLEAAKSLDFVTIGKLWTETINSIKNLFTKCFSSNDEVELKDYIPKGKKPFPPRRPNKQGNYKGGYRGGRN
jgi:hypothetical protein